MAMQGLVISWRNRSKREENKYTIITGRFTCQGEILVPSTSRLFNQSLTGSVFQYDNRAPWCATSTNFMPTVCTSFQLVVKVWGVRVVLRLYRGDRM